MLQNFVEFRQRLTKLLNLITGGLVFDRWANALRAYVVDDAIVHQT